MKALLKARSIRNTLISAAAASVMTLPLLASASAINNTDSDVRITYEKTELASTRGQTGLYARLKDASRKICGSSNIRITGSLQNSAVKAQCYNETLTAAVERVGNPEITALHNN